ncbi:hypothetical protein HDU83_007156 [Entophlyctis luteolus]|nr:hypothetical protein HDU83_007156 [Entophlyctis luteolus]
MTDRPAEKKRAPPPPPPVSRRDRDRLTGTPPSASDAVVGSSGIVASAGADSPSPPAIQTQQLPPPLPARPSASAATSATSPSMSTASLSRAINGINNAKPYLPRISPSISRSVPYAGITSTHHELSHKGVMRAFGVLGSKVLTVGDRHLRLFSFDKATRLAGPISAAAHAFTSAVELAAIPIPSVVGFKVEGGVKDVVPISTIAVFPPTSPDSNAELRICLGIEKTAEIVLVDLMKRDYSVSIIDRRQVMIMFYKHNFARQNTGSHILWSLDDQGGLRIWSLDPLTLVRTLRVGTRQAIAHVVHSRLLWTASGKTLEIHDPSGASFLRARVDVTGVAGGFLCFAGGEDVSMGSVFSGHDDGKVVVWEAGTGARRYVVSTGIYRVSSLTFASTGVPGSAGNMAKARLWIGFGTGRISVFDVSAWDAWVLVKEFQGHDNSAVSYLSLGGNNNNNVVFSCSMDSGSMKAWDAFLQKDWVDNFIRERESEFSSYRNISVLIATYNINASKPDILDNLPAWQQFLQMWFTRHTSTSKEAPAIICIGFQELVDLESKKANAKQMLMEVVAAAGNRIAGGSVGDLDASGRVALWKERIIKTLATSLPDVRYRLLECHSLFGLFQIVFVREDEYYKCQAGCVDIGQVKTGLGGFHANKDHENVFFSGDLNYRIDSTRETVMSAIAKKDFSFLLVPVCLITSSSRHSINGFYQSNDQLITQLSTNANFGLRQFREPPISFEPTFKYDAFSTHYDTSEKKRVPAWCDRILYKGDGILPEYYERGECTMSDHRPVSAGFTVRVKQTDARKYEDVRVRAAEAARAMFEI